MTECTGTADMLQDSGRQVEAPGWSAKAQLSFDLYVAIGQGVLRNTI